jgi:hypothetical protein
MVIEASPCALVRIRWGAADLTPPPSAAPKHSPRERHSGHTHSPAGGASRGGARQNWCQPFSQRSHCTILSALWRPLHSSQAVAAAGLAGEGSPAACTRHMGEAGEGKGSESARPLVIPAAPG